MRAVQLPQDALTGVHGVTTLFSLTQDPCQKWESLGLGKATQMYQRTQQVLKAARLLPAHRRLPHKAQSRKKASTGPHFTIMSDQRPHPSAAKSWSRCRSGVSQCSNVDCIPGKWGGVAMQHAVEKTFLVAQPVQPVALTSPVACYQSAINKWRP